ncbi:MAG: hypothetical protein IPJ29_15275 [Chitinophagaceae bacterium]|nr:hypothetical protein [Chitinophagaceae bacterium]
MNISVYSANNQLIGTGSTDKDGVATIAYSKKILVVLNPQWSLQKQRMISTISL